MKSSWLFLHSVRVRTLHGTMLKFEDNPPRLFPVGEDISKRAGAWWVAHTKPRAEKSLARELVNRGISYFLPMAQRVRMSGGRKRRLMLPLFPSYLFFTGDREACAAALATGKVVQIIKVRDQQELAGELAAIERVLATNTPLDPLPNLAVGSRCRVTAGPFEGVEGRVIRRDNVARFVLHVTMLGRGVVMEIEPDLLEVVE